MKVYAVLVTVLVAVMIWYLAPLLKNKLETEKQASIYRKIEQYVEAAEQLIQGAARGAERLDYVEKLLDEDGVTVTGQVRAMIEVAVYRMQIGGQR